jgi:alkylated DNA repair protein (DNA oxidative demethylase)
MPQRLDDAPQLPGFEPAPLPAGFHFLPGHFNAAEQTALLAELRQLLAEAPLFQQAMPRSGAPLSVRMSGAGTWGWVTDKVGGYRYQRTHPVTGQPWPAIPERLLRLWAEVTGEARPPNQCLINYYDAKARLGLHQDKDAVSLDGPVVSVSLGDDARFVVGGLSRQAPLQRLDLHSGDVVWFGGPGRLLFHGVDRIRFGSSALLAEGGRLNVTLRRIEGVPRPDGTLPG